MSVDGQVKVSIDNQTQLEIRKSNHRAKLVKLPNNSYFKTLRMKMGWAGNVR